MPHITEITVHAGRVFNHPYESYSNLRPGVTLKAMLLDGEDALTETKKLQQQAEELVEEHKRAMLESLHQLERLTEREQQIARLSQMLQTNQAELDRLRDEVDSDRRQMGLLPEAEAEREPDDGICF